MLKGWAQNRCPGTKGKWVRLLLQESGTEPSWTAMNQRGNRLSLIIQTTPWCKVSRWLQIQYTDESLWACDHHTHTYVVSEQPFPELVPLLWLYESLLFGEEFPLEFGAWLWRFASEFGQGGQGHSQHSSSAQRCLVESRSGLRAGRLSYSTSTMAGHAFMDLVLCTVAFSCWNMVVLDPLVPVKGNCYTTAYKDILYIYMLCGNFIATLGKAQIWMWWSIIHKPYAM